MAAPPETNPARWDYAVAEVRTAMKWPRPRTDTWLNKVWVNMWTGDEAAGEPAAHAYLRTRLETGATNKGGSNPTFPRTFHDWAVDPAPPPAAAARGW